MSKELLQRITALESGAPAPAGGAEDVGKRMLKIRMKRRRHLKKKQVEHQLKTS